MDIERSIIGKVLGTGRVAPVIDAQIRPEHFADDECRAVFEHILRHAKSYGDAPSQEAIRERFPAFELHHVQDSIEYVLDAFRRRLLKRVAQEELLRVADVAADDERLPTIAAEFRAIGDRLAQLSDGHREQWPQPMGEAAYHGLAGAIVRKIAPHTEADEHAVLVQLLAAVGNAAGRTPHLRIEADRHGTNLYVALVGHTASGRKGVSRAQAFGPVAAADPQWSRERQASCLSSGEGVIYALRDRVSRLKDGEQVVVDEGVRDKRLMVVEPEFASVLKVGRREGEHPVDAAAPRLGRPHVADAHAQLAAQGQQATPVDHRPHHARRAAPRAADIRAGERLR